MLCCCRCRNQKETTHHRFESSKWLACCSRPRESREATKSRRAKTTLRCALLRPGQPLLLKWLSREEFGVATEPVNAVQTVRTALVHSPPQMRLVPFRTLSKERRTPTRLCAQIVEQVLIHDLLRGGGSEIARCGRKKQSETNSK